jgi:hypothetical protein
MGGLCLLAFAGAVYNNWGDLAIGWDGSWPWLIFDIAMLAVFPIVFGSGISFITAGNRWMRGRWISAIVLIAIPCLLLAAVEFIIMDLLHEWAKNSP